VSLLQVHGALVAAASAALAGVEVEYENAQFVKPTATKWARIHFLPNAPSVETLGNEGQDLVDGIMQIDLNYPQNTGDGQARQDFEEVRAAFPAGVSYSTGGQVVTIKNCGRSQGRLVDQWYRVSITVYWYALIPR
jgi:hypothetical protein